MSFEITATGHFSASHQLRMYDGSLEPLHGHNWKVSVTVAGEKLDKIGVVMDFHVLHRLMERAVGAMHNRHLNDLPAFSQANPSAENVAGWVGKQIDLPEGIKLVRVEVWETDDFSAVYRP